MFQVQTFTFNPFYENTYVVYDKLRSALIIDAGCYGSEEESALASFISAEGLRPTDLWNTHVHLDHVLGSAYVQRRWSVPFCMPIGEESMFQRSDIDASRYGFENYRKAVPNMLLRAGAPWLWEKHKVTILGVPGHSPDHLAFYFEKEGLLFSGDVLFRESIGRADLPGGDMDTLLRSIREQLFVLPDDTKVYPGHGEPTTVGYEKKHNPFLR